MKKKLPAWAPADTPGHFLKHADEQTVMAVSAVDQAIESAQLDIKELQNWSVIAAPRFIGRTAGTATLERFGRGGGPAISPHLIPQHSLHSISGALSILLSTRLPNFGVGGTGESLTEGLLATLIFPAGGRTGTLLVATSWEPEPQLDDQGNCTNSPVCHAVALALQTAAPSMNCGRLSLTVGESTAKPHNAAMASTSAADLATALTALTPGGPAHFLAWRLPWGATLQLEVRQAIGKIAAAA